MFRALTVRQMGAGAILCFVAVACGCGCNGGGSNNVPTGGGANSKPSGDSSLSGAINIDGSSTVFKLTQAVAQEFAKTHGGVRIKVDKSGTGGGFKNFVLGKLDICDASRPIQESEMKLCRENSVEYIELPVAFDALTVAVNSKNDWADAMTVEELKKMWEPAAEGKVTNWNQIRSEWPDAKISLFGADSESGTYEYFTEAIVGKKNQIRSDYSQLADDNAIILGIEGDKNALGYVPYAYFAPREGKTLNAVKIDWKPDDELGPIGPSVESVVNATYNPLSRPLFIYVHRKAADRPEVKAFVDYYMENGKSLCEKVKYIPLPATGYSKGHEEFKQLQTGTRFGGHSVIGKSIEQILELEPKP